MANPPTAAVFMSLDRLADQLFSAISEIYFYTRRVIFIILLSPAMIRWKYFRHLNIRADRISSHSLVVDISVISKA